ncbi:MAG: pantoate--beta-alanine ligase [Acidobacteriota bacterium]
MQLIQTVAGLRDALAPVRRSGASVGLAPTMGALHAGHGRLIELARQETGCVVVSIFVNPIQFNQKDDYERYPRDLARDLEFCRARGVDVVFVPEISEMYPSPQRTFVEVERLTEHLCGRFRPGHFRGVATVVMKLLNIVQPDRAYFGEKDAQQLAVIRRMVRDLDVPVEIVPVATVREPDGLALSSRNQRLSAAERRVAPALYQVLQRAGERIAAGVTDVQAVKMEALAAIEGLPGLRVEYLEFVDPEDMQPVERIAGPVRVMAAVWVGATRLIDNVLCPLAAVTQVTEIA